MGGVLNAPQSRELVKAREAHDMALKPRWYGGGPDRVGNVKVKPVSVPAHLASLALKCLSAVLYPRRINQIRLPGEILPYKAHTLQ